VKANGAKEPSNQQPVRRNVVGQRSGVQQTAKTKLSRVGTRSQENPEGTFNNLGHILSLEYLRECFESLDGNKAIGIDGVTKQEYGKNLQNNLEELLLRIRNGSYYPRPTRTVEIPKCDGTTRPIAVGCLVDKIVQEAVRRILEAIYEPHFLPCSHGFRPNRSCHGALVHLDTCLMEPQTRAVLDVDIKSCFPSIPHENLIEILSKKITDTRFLYLIIKLIRNDGTDGSGKVVKNTCGLPQGSILSPILMNIFLHESIDKWFLGLTTFGGCHIVRYADDMVITAKSVAQAETLLRKLKERLKICGLEVHEGKTHVVKAGSNAAQLAEQNKERMPTFTFLGFLHVWGKSINRKTGKIFWRVKRRTCPKRFRAKLKVIAEKFMAGKHKVDFLNWTKQVVNGYLEYFAVNDNMKRVSQFVYEVRRIIRRCLNRRGQRKEISWEKFNQILEAVNFPKPRLRHNLFFVPSASRRC